ncbi:MAG: putative manganese-dependent inorganic diphosphatase [Coriobacteriales bacterium]|nr:putative manganese-dependent inorganic diphosphatase [Coriobacteriales bacterium]
MDTTRERTVLVVGHRNPDNDSIMSAVAYADLKAQVDPDHDYRAVRLGPLPAESAWLLERYRISPPPVIAHVYGRVEDAMTAEPVAVDEHATILEAGLLMRARGIRALVVTTGPDKAYRGLFSNRMLGDLFISNLDAHESREDLLGQEVKDHLDDSALMLKPDVLLHDAKEDILNSKLRQAVVLDDDGSCVGIITRTDIARTPHRRVILVDHNEQSQAVSGIEEAVVMEVVDHHRIGDIQTASPIQFLAMPLGSTATIVALEFRRHGVEPRKAVAACLLSAVLTDTVLLKSPTATEQDAKVVEWLAGLVGVEWHDFGMEVFASRDAAEPPTPERILDGDAKEYEFGDKRALVVQFETVSLDSVIGLADDLQQAMVERAEQHGYDFIVALLTDVIKEGSQFFACGDVRTVERAFGFDLSGGSVWVPGMLSRKKQVVPTLTEHVS